MTYPGQRAQMSRNPNWQPPPPPRTETPATGARAPLATTATSEPGAYSISRNHQGPMQVYRVTVPPNVSPNQEFQVYGKILYEEFDIAFYLVCHDFFKN
jgi:hypothetical protein